MTSSLRYLIVNADDFGLSSGVNRGIIRAFEEGIVTSTSLMVRSPAAVEAVAEVRGRPRLSLGLHIDLGEWTYSEGEWHLTRAVIPAGDAAAAAREVAAQLQTFRRLVGRDPTHLDSHQHVHREEPVHAAVASMAAELGVVLRDESPHVRYCGNFYGQSDKGYPHPQGISVESLLTVLHDLRPGVTELGCHPADKADTDSVYNRERVDECRALCDPRVRAALAAEQIVLCSFADLWQIELDPIEPVE